MTTRSKMHASVSLLAYGAFALACIAGVMFLVQDRLLRRGDLRALSYELPPVTNLATAIVRLMAIGLILLSLGIASGFGTARPPSGVHLLLSSRSLDLLRCAPCGKVVEGAAVLGNGPSCRDRVRSAGHHPDDAGTLKSN